MPTHKIHLAIARKVNDKLNMDLDGIMIGSVLPDMSSNDHDISHFQNGKNGLDGLSNPDLFVKKYKDKLNNPVMMGYLIHLLSDRFYNEYMFKHYFIYDDNGNDIGLHFKNKDVLLPFDKIKYYKHRELGLYDYYLINHNYLDKFKNYDCINNIEDIEEVLIDKNKVKDYINSSNKDFNKVNIINKIRSNYVDYKLTNRKNLDSVFDECVKYILNYLKENSLIN